MARPPGRSSVVSDVTSNSIRVVKTTKQSAQTALTYKEAVQMIVEKDGMYGLFFRGLNTRILSGRAADRGRAGFPTGQREGGCWYIYV